MELFKKAAFYSGGRKGKYRFPKNSLLISRDKPGEFSFLNIENINVFFDQHNRIGELVAVLDESEQAEYIAWTQAKARYEKWGTMPEEAIEEVLSWQFYSKSPYSHSYYNAEVDWDHKPEGSLRLSDHWSWEDVYGIRHCRIKGEESEVRKWLLCRFESGWYVVLKEY
jgi:hypothetical protein